MTGAALAVPLMMLIGALVNRWSFRRLLLGCGFGIAYCLLVSLSGEVWQAAVARVLNANRGGTCRACGTTSHYQLASANNLGDPSTLQLARACADRS